MADLPNQSNSLDDFGDEENEQLHEGEVFIYMYRYLYIF